jgi:hypothetical protein
VIGEASRLNLGTDVVSRTDWLADRAQSAFLSRGHMTRNIDAVVLVGGQGRRLRPLTLSARKPMPPTASVPS